MPTYVFECPECHNQQDFTFLIAEYDTLVKNGIMQDTCVTCNKKQPFNRILTDFQVLGGATGYKSVERYWEENPSLKRQKEEQMRSDIEKRKEWIKQRGVSKKVHSKRRDRNKGYKEDKLKFND